MATSTPKVLDARVTGHQFEIPDHPRVEPLIVEGVLKDKGARVYCIGADTSSLDALKLMAEQDVEAVVVTDDGRVKGTFSERDYARLSARLAEMAPGVRVGEAMTSSDTYASPIDSVETCLKVMSEKRLRYLPVQGDSGPVALLSLDDLHSEMALHHAKVYKAIELDQQIQFLQGTYSC